MTPSRPPSRAALPRFVLLVTAGALALAGPGAASGQEVPPGATTAEVLEGAKDSDWRDLDPESTLYLTLAGSDGRVVIELAPDFAYGFVDGSLWLFQIRPFIRYGNSDVYAALSELDAGARANADREVRLADPMEGA
jgi:hypothetical protein